MAPADGHHANEPDAGIDIALLKRKYGDRPSDW